MKFIYGWCVSPLPGRLRANSFNHETSWLDGCECGIQTWMFIYLNVKDATRPTALCDTEQAQWALLVTDSTESRKRSEWLRLVKFWPIKCRVELRRRHGQGGFQCRNVATPPLSGKSGWTHLLSWSLDKWVPRATISLLQYYQCNRKHIWMLTLSKTAQQW